MSIDVFVKQHEVERKFVETGAWDATDKQLDLMMKLYQSSGQMDSLRSKIAIEVAKNQQTINYYNSSADMIRENAKNNITIEHNYIDELHQKHKGQTVIIIAFGPSLMKNIDVLFALREKYIIIAVDRAIGYLFEHGIRPDYYVTCDAYCDSDWIPDVDLAGIKLISLIMSNYGFNNRFKTLCGEVYFFQSLDRAGIWREISALAGDLPYLNCSGNVGHAALMVGIYLFEAEKAVLCGFDNSFNSYYYPDKSDAPQGTLQTVDINGDDVFTLDEFLSYNYYMTETIMNGNEDKVVNCTEGGILKIKHHDKLINYL